MGGMRADDALNLARAYAKKTLQGQGALKGQDGFSPTVKENKNNTADDYRFDVTDKNGTFTTPNLIGKEGKNGKDGKTPTITIGANNNWFVNGVDTGVKAKGEKGDTGSGFNTTRQYSSVSDMMADTNPANDSEIVVVVLGDVGNFYMRLSSYVDPDGITNGYLPIGSAQDISTIKGDPGKDGTDGITPHIDSATKHWFLGTNDTGVLAEGKDGVDGVDGTDGIDGKNVTVTEFSGNNGGIYKLVIQDVNGTIITPNLLGINGGGDTPVGHILSYMGITAPEHYLSCDGAVYNISKYPELANHFQREFGSSNFFGGNGTTTFAVPDLRGEFLRGTGTATRNTGTGASVGVHQKPTTHMTIGYDSYYQTFYHAANGTKASSVNNAIYDAYGNEDKLYKSTDTVGRSIETNGTYSAEGNSTFTSRPTNTAVLYCIKCESTEQKDTYSTNEIKVGTWVDGKPVYRKVIEGVTSGTPDKEYVIHTISNIKKTVSYYGSILDNNMVSHKMGTYLSAKYNSVVFVDTRGNVYMRHGSAMVNKNYSLIIEYTKTTD